MSAIVRENGNVDIAVGKGTVNDSRLDHFWSWEQQARTIMVRLSKNGNVSKSKMI